jgi:hypothetical protein
LINQESKFYAVVKAGPLKTSLAVIGSWKQIGDIFLDPQVTSKLLIEDYINQTYSSGKQSVSHNIGYYFISRIWGSPLSVRLLSWIEKILGNF